MHACIKKFGDVFCVFGSPHPIHGDRIYCSGETVLDIIFDNPPQRRNITKYQPYATIYAVSINLEAKLSTLT